MNIRDTIERLFWTALSAFLSGLTAGQFFDIDALEAAGMAGLTAGVNFLTLLARQQLNVLPAPGAGLPGLPVAPPK